MGRDARVYRDRHGRGARGVTSDQRAAQFAAAVASARVALESRWPTSMSRITIAIEDQPTAADLQLAEDHVPAGRVITAAGRHVVTVFRAPIEARTGDGGGVAKFVLSELEALVQRALGR